MPEVLFTRTAKAANNDRLSRWALIECIAADAIDNGLLITSAKSGEAAMEALEAVGSDLAAKTVLELCLVAKFDHESTAKQRKVWRRYGWTVISTVAKAGWTPEAACGLLDTTPLQRREDVSAAVGNRSGPVAPSLDERWAKWVNAMNRLMTEGASLAAESESEPINGHSELARTIYRRVTERQLDAELRQLLDEAAGERT